MPRPPRSLVRALLALFAAVQLSPAGLTICRDDTGGVSFGCTCADCQAAEGTATAACCQDDGCPRASRAADFCPACGQQLAAAASGMHSSLQACCEHSSVEYATPAMQQMQAPAEHAAAPALAPPGPARLGLLVAADWNTAGCQRAYPPPGACHCPAASGAAVQPLRL